jgi:hypothetical protein
LTRFERKQPGVINQSRVDWKPSENQASRNIDLVESNINMGNPTSQYVTMKNSPHL